ncbi:MAG: hypothetical protein KDA22_15625, partial [Phycisphaerales bacterium]|nr:hypothetical protein [Phycisphaerales bacterium]
MAAPAANAADAVSAFGLPHHALGDATLEAVDGAVVVTNLSGTGRDGVAVRLGDAAGWRGHVDFGPAGALATAARLTLSASYRTEGGEASGGATHTVGVSIQETDGGLAAVRLRSLGCACATTLELRLGDAVVQAVDLPAPPAGVVAVGAFGSIADQAPDLRAERTADALGEIDAAFVLTNPEAIPIALLGGAPVVADEL